MDIWMKRQTSGEKNRDPRKMLSDEDCSLALELYPEDQPDLAFFRFSVDHKDPPTALHAILESVNNMLSLNKNDSESTRVSKLDTISKLKLNGSVNPQALDAALYYINTNLILERCIVIGPSIFFVLYEILFSGDEVNKQWFQIAVRGAIGFAAKDLEIEHLSSIRRFTFGAQVGEHTDDCKNSDHKTCHDHFSTISINLRLSTQDHLLGNIAIYDSLQMGDQNTLHMCRFQISAAKKIVEAIVGEVQWNTPVAPQTPVQQSVAGESCSSFTAHYVLKAHLGLTVYEDHPCEDILNQQAYDMASASMHLDIVSPLITQLFHDAYNLSIIKTPSNSGKYPCIQYV